MSAGFDRDDPWANFPTFSEEPTFANDPVGYYLRDPMGFFREMQAMQEMGERGLESVPQDAPLMSFFVPDKTEAQAISRDDCERLRSVLVYFDDLMNSHPDLARRFLVDGRRAMSYRKVRHMFGIKNGTKTGPVLLESGVGEFILSPSQATWLARILISFGPLIGALTDDDRNGFEETPHAEVWLRLLDQFR